MFLFKALGIYLLMQVAILFILHALPKPQLINQIRRSVFVGIANHLYFIIAGALGSTLLREASKINFIGAFWAIPLGLIGGFFLFIIIEVASRLAKRFADERLLDLQLFALTPIIQRNILIPGLLNYIALKPLGEELFFRAFVVGVLSTQINVFAAVLIAVILENLRYPQIAWFSRNTLRAALLSILFIMSPTLLLPLSVSISCGILSALNQISKVKNAMNKERNVVDHKS